MLGERSDDRADKTRLCPHCRMPISVLATKCRFCGEEVGRPKDQSRSLTVDDLGGERGSRYAPSSSVMEALESFRVEETSNVETPAPSRSWSPFRRNRKARSLAQTPRDGGMPALDERGKALASLAMPVRPVASLQRPAEPSWMKKVIVFASFVATVLLLIIGATQVIAMIRKEDAPVQTAAELAARRARAALDQGELLVALDACLDAVQKANTRETREMLAKARANVRQHVENLLNSEPFSDRRLLDAVNLARRAETIDPSSEIRSLREMAEAEGRSCWMRLVDLDAGKKTATFQVNGPSNPCYAPDEPSYKETYKIGDVINGRFRVLNITRTHVRVRDTARNDRRMLYSFSGIFPPDTTIALTGRDQSEEPDIATSGTGNGAPEVK